MESVVFVSCGLKTLLRTEHGMFKLKMLNQTHLLSNVLYLRVLLSVNFIFDSPGDEVGVKDMPNCLAKANRTFADDTTLFYSSNSLQDLEKTINKEFKHLLSYCSANNLSVNFEKTQ